MAMLNNQRVYGNIGELLSQFWNEPSQAVA